MDLRKRNKLKNIKWIFFDMGSTLIDERTAYQKRIERTIANTKISYNDFYCKMTELYRQNKKGDKETAEYFGLRLADWNSNDESVYPESESCLKRLSQNYKIGIIANQNSGSEERLKKFGLLQYISIITAPAEEGVAKPDLRIFEIALERAECQANQAVMVGDRLDNDIAPANQIGMKTVWIKQGFGSLSYPVSDNEIPTYTVNNLNELYDLMKVD